MNLKNFFLFQISMMTVFFLFVSVFTKTQQSHKDVKVIIIICEFCIYFLYHCLSTFYTVFHSEAGLDSVRILKFYFQKINKKTCYFVHNNKIFGGGKKQTNKQILSILKKRKSDYDDDNRPTKKISIISICKSNVFFFIC